MKSSFLGLLIVVVIFSCSKDGNLVNDKYSLVDDKYPQKWALVKMSGQLPNSQTTGENMEWQEYYILKSNGSFIKHRERDGVDSEASGSFIFVDKTDGKFLELTYTTDSEIIGSCNANQTESLWLKSDNKLVGTWSYCDGPGLEYERKE